MVSPKFRRKSVAIYNDAENKQKTNKQKLFSVPWVNYTYNFFPIHFWIEDENMHKHYYIAYKLKAQTAYIQYNRHVRGTISI